MATTRGTSARKSTTARPAAAKRATKRAATKQDKAEQKGAEARAAAEQSLDQEPKAHQTAHTVDEATDRGFYGYSPDPNPPEDYQIGGRLAAPTPPTAESTGAVEAPGTQSAAGQAPGAPDPEGN